MPEPGDDPSPKLLPERNDPSPVTSAAIAGLGAGSLASNVFAAAAKAGTAEQAKADEGKHDCKGQGGRSTMAKQAGRQKA